MIDTATLELYRFHRENGGTAQGSLNCARARLLLDKAIDLGIAEITWEYEQERYEDVFGFESEDEREQFYSDLESNRITGPFYCVLTIAGEHRGSLGMIMLGPRELDDYYAKLVEVELAMDVEDDLRQAIGDALDAEQPSLL